MNKTLIAMIGTTKIDKPSNVGEPAGYTLQLMKDGVPVGQVVAVSDNASPVDFSITEPGGYTLSVARVDATGTVIGAAVLSDVIQVAPDKVDIPATIRMTLQDNDATVDVPFSANGVVV